MAASTLPINGSNPRLSFFTHHSASVLHWQLMGGQHSRMLTRTTRRYALRMLANPNVSSRKREVIMVDPLEAKRLAAKQMEEIKAKEKLERRRKIEAINGAWAMIGLTAGLVIEGHTGKSILGQLDGYWHAIMGLATENDTAKSILGQLDGYWHASLGVVVEDNTVKSILGQLDGYWHAVLSSIPR